MSFQRFWRIKIRALARGRHWSELEHFAKSKSPIGLLSPLLSAWHCTHSHTHSHTQTYRDTDTHRHTDTHTRTHTHTHTLSLSLSGCRCLGRGRWLLQGMRHLCRPASPWSTWRMPSSTLTSCQRSVGALLLRVTTSSLLHEIQSFFALMSAEFSSLLALCF